MCSILTPLWLHSAERFIDETDLLSARQEDENLELKVHLDERPKNVEFFCQGCRYCSIERESQEYFLHCQYQSRPAVKDMMVDETLESDPCSRDSSGSTKQRCNYYSYYSYITVSVWGTVGLRRYNCTPMANILQDVLAVKWYLF